MKSNILFGILRSASCEIDTPLFVRSLDWTLLCSSLLVSSNSSSEKSMLTKQPRLKFKELRFVVLLLGGIPRLWFLEGVFVGGDIGPAGLGSCSSEGKVERVESDVFSAFGFAMGKKHSTGLKEILKSLLLVFSHALSDKNPSGFELSPCGVSALDGTRLAGLGLLEDDFSEGSIFVLIGKFFF